MTRRPLPTPAFVLILIATICLWLVVLAVGLGVLASLAGGADPLNLLGVPAISDGALQTAIGLQLAGTVLTVAICLVLGTVISILHLGSTPQQAAPVALLLLRLLIGMIVLRLLLGFGPIYVTGGFGAVLPALAVSLPTVLIEIGLLLCADRFLSRPPASVF